MFNATPDTRPAGLLGDTQGFFYEVGGNRKSVAILVSMAGTWCRWAACLPTESVGQDSVGREKRFPGRLPKTPVATRPKREGHQEGAGVRPLQPLGEGGPRKNRAYDPSLDCALGARQIVPAVTNTSRKSEINRYTNQPIRSHPADCSYHVKKRLQSACVRHPLLLYYRSLQTSFGCCGRIPSGRKVPPTPIHGAMRIPNVESNRQ